MDWFAGEPTLEETLSDPVVKAVMECDDVDLDGLRKFLAEIGSRLEASRETRTSRASTAVV